MLDLLFTILLILMLAGCVAPARAGDCPTDEAKLDAISDFIHEHYGNVFSMISSPPEDLRLFELTFWPYEPEVECTGAVRVADDCAVSVEQAIVCSR